MGCLVDRCYAFWIELLCALIFLCFIILSFKFQVIYFLLSFRCLTWSSAISIIKFNLSSEFYTLVITYIISRNLFLFSDSFQKQKPKKQKQKSNLLLFYKCNNMVFIVFGGNNKLVKIGLKLGGNKLFPLICIGSATLTITVCSSWSFTFLVGFHPTSDRKTNLRRRLAQVFFAID